MLVPFKRFTPGGIRMIFGLLTLIALACRLGSTLETTPTPAATSEVVVVTVIATPLPPPFMPISDPTPAPLGLDATPAPAPDTSVKVTIQDLQLATVQILAKNQVGGRMQTVWTGSGTLISPDGLILTNAHVASPSTPGLAALYNDPELLFGEPPDALVIALVERADRPPIEKFLADVLAADGSLDLAVIQIQATVSGRPIDNDSLNLPYVEIGDSDRIELGDEIRVLGFPGAGGETITFTRGDVSGFESQPLVGVRAWIKTDTSISPGNSGGLGVNVAGQIIGVPSFAIEAAGGAINRLRAINLAKPLVEAAKSGRVYESPYVVAGTGGESLSLVTWAEDFSAADGCPIGPLSAYAPGTLAVVAVFDYQGMTDGEQLVIAWFYEDELLFTEIVNWEGGTAGDCYPVYAHNFGEPLAEGSYAVEVYAGDELTLAGAAETEVGRTAITGGVQVQGRITDAASGRPIAGAALFILNPGADLDAWLDSPTDADVFTFAETDANGEYRLPALLQRGISYPGVAAAEGYRPTDGLLTVAQDDPDVLTVDLQLNR